MAKTVIDLSNFKDRVGGRVDPGRYLVQVEDVEEVTAKSGNKMFNLYLRVVGGEHEGTTILDRLPQTENALFRTVNFLQALGIPTPRKRLSIDIGKWNGRMLEVDVEDGDPYNGRVRSEVRGFSKASSSNPREADEDSWETPSEDVPDDDSFKKEQKETKSSPETVPAEGSEDGENADDIDVEEVDL